MNPNKRNAGQGAFVALCGIVALSSVLLWASPAAARELPFKGRIDGTFVATATANPIIMLSQADAVGRTTHLGAFTKVTSDVFNVATGETVGSFTMTAANGDLLTGVYRGFLTFGATPGTFSWLLDATITGGTGRFLHATGEFVFIAEGSFDFVNGAVHGKYTETFEGTISY